MEAVYFIIVGVVIGLLFSYLKNRGQRSGDEVMKQAFGAIALEALRNSGQDFLNLAKRDLQGEKDVISKELEQKEKNFEKLVKSVHDSVESVRTRVGDLEKERKEQLGALGESIKHVLETGGKMLDTASDLKNAISSNSAVRGRWGEAVLRNLLEDSQLTEGIDFSVQETIPGEEGSSLRPDVIVKFPDGLRLAIDSKASLGEFLNYLQESDPTMQKQHIEGFVSQLRSRIRQLASKEYQRYIDPKMPYVVMFIPGENAVRAAFACDPDLYKEAQSKKVMLASPATIMPLLLLVAHAWKQYKSSENAQRLYHEVGELNERLKTFFHHVNDVGESLSGATKKFNAAVGSWDARVIPKIEQIKSLGGNMEVSGDDMKMIEEEPRVSNKSPSSKKKKEELL